MWEWKVAAGGNNYPKLGECRIMEGITAAELYGKAIAGNDNWSPSISSCKIGFALIVWIKKSEEVKFEKIQLFLTELQHGHSKNRWIPHRILKFVLDKVNWYGFPELPFIRYHIQFIFETFGQRCLEIKYKNTMLKRILD